MRKKKTLQKTFPTPFAYFKSEWSHIEEEAFDMLIGKGVYPYEYIDSWNKFDECILPRIDCFHSTLTNLNIFEQDHKFAQELWEKFHLKNIGDLHDLYMNTDVKLLADVLKA